MSKGSTPAADPDIGGIEQEDASTNQEATPLPLFAGERVLKTYWLMPAVNQFTKEAPAERPEKK
jgi:hypothetical protein